MIQISPMIPTEYPQQATPAYGRFFLACVCAVLILAIIGGSALCATSLTGHTTSKEVIRYTKAARQKVLAKSAVKLMDQAADDSND